MRHLAMRLATVSVLLAVTTPAAAVVIDFEDLVVGTALSNQYAGLGVTFSPNAFSGPGGPTGNWATNTDLTIVSSTGGDVGGLGTPSLVSGNMVRSFDGWLGENGDPSLLISFSGSINSFSLDFAGIFTSSSTRLFIFDGSTLLDTVVATGSTGQETLSFSAPSFTSVVVTPGEFNDWVGFDNLEFTFADVIPEPSSWAMMIAGFGLTGAMLRRRRKAAAA